MTPSLTATPKLHPFTNRILIAVDLRIFAQEAREHFASREHSASAANFTHAFMASIAIPSPSAFLASPVLPTPPSPANAASEAKEKQPAKAKAQIPKAKTDGVTKPKQSKSRNGESHPSPQVGRVVLRSTHPAVIQDRLLMRHRMCDLQGEKAQVRRDKAYLPTVS